MFTLVEKTSRVNNKALSQHIKLKKCQVQLEFAKNGQSFESGGIFIVT